MGDSHRLVDATNAIAAAIRGLGHIDLNPSACMLASTGGPMAVFANSTNNPSVPGPQLTDSEAISVRWNNAATTTGIATSRAIPKDLDPAYPIVFKAIVSKTGATLADASTLTLGCFITKGGSLHDADADCGGATGAVTGDATAKTETLLTRTIAAADVVAACPDPSATNGVINCTIKVTDGTLGTDDLCLHAAWLEYTKRGL